MRMPGEFRFHRTRRNVPHKNRVVLLALTCTYQRLAIGTEQYTTDHMRMPGEFRFHTTCHNIPQKNCRGPNFHLRTSCHQD